MRLDVYLTENGLVKSRNKAAETIAGGFVKVNGRTVEKASYAVLPTDVVELAGRPYDYVSRGGVKLASALDAFHLSPAGLVACDIGASTGGFTDCLLKRGAARVYAIDSGREQLDNTLRADPRVRSIEGFNARELSLETVGERCGIIVGDVSFISQTYILPRLPLVSEEGAILVFLIKPQFECGREALNKNGVVRDKKFHLAAIRRVLSSAVENGFSPRGLMKSVITGGDGNVEYLYYAIREDSPSQIDERKMKEVVE